MDLIEYSKEIQEKFGMAHFVIFDNCIYYNRDMYPVIKEDSMYFFTSKGTGRFTKYEYSTGEKLWHTLDIKVRKAEDVLADWL